VNLTKKTEVIENKTACSSQIECHFLSAGMLQFPIKMKIDEAKRLVGLFPL
jgi:hypothetical protein